MVRRTRDVLSPWVTLTSRWMAGPGFDDDVAYHSLEQADYVTVLATTVRGDVILVEQYRPALERVTLELPGGIAEPGRDPASVAAAELLEEAGLRPDAHPLLLGVLDPDSGRLENRLWCYLAEACRPVEGWAPEPHVRPVQMTPSELAAAVADGTFSHALHIAVLALAAAQGRFPLGPLTSVRGSG